ncbi:hypothetical protein AB4Y30_04000 [Ornithinibacillus sp. 4-3]|uniref:SMI1/KNR4 family protein n=1 Tax=Ornithinibacillus sp. 4-3 TaxID=3231488 RepID=A0AB39HS17_9BACI
MSNGWEGRRETRQYGNGWISFDLPVLTNITITQALTAIRDSSIQDQCLDFGKVHLGPSGNPPRYLTALDHKTQIPLSPQLQEFYSFARWWRNSILLMEVIDPDAYFEHLTNPNLHLGEVLANEFSHPYVLVDEDECAIDPARCVLFSLDTLDRYPYNRVYLVFGDKEEPEVWGFREEHFHSPNLLAYLVNGVPHDGIL